MPDPAFDKLLELMPRIAEAVNHFQSADLQRQAFQALVDTFADKRPKPAPAHTEAQPAPLADVSSGGGARGNRRRDPVRYAPKIVRDLDLTPAGKKSFADFIAEKQPQSNQDRYAAVVYYLEHELGLPAVTLDHVATVFRVTPNWKEPTNILSGITAAASRKGTIDTSSLNSLKTTPVGRNFVEHELPAKSGE
ncbi:MAG TPA: hypothetical protein VJ825_02605 [Gemmatimonadaceae bacterium]|nr:hypothetical protein [Gemmatimonadaceae bacterium]